MKPLANQSVYICGRCLLEPRQQLQTWIQQQGGKCVRHLSKKLTYFVLGIINYSYGPGKNLSAAYKKARELNKKGAKIYFLSELELLVMLNKRSKQVGGLGDYSKDKVSKLTGMEPEFIDECMHLGLINSKAEFAYRDVVLVNDIKKIMQQGGDLYEIAKTYHQILQTLGDDPQIHHLSLFLDQGRVSARYKGKSIQATGQYSLEFDRKQAQVGQIGHCAKDGQIWFRRAIELEREGHLDQAESAYRKAIKGKPYQGISYYNLGNVRRKQGELRDAIECYRMAISYAPDLYLSWYNLAYCYDELKQYDLAIEAYHRAIKLNPIFANAHFNLGRCYLVLDKKGLAKKYWQRYLQLQPKGEWAALVEEHMQ